MSRNKESLELVHDQIWHRMLNVLDLSLYPTVMIMLLKDEFLLLVCFDYLRWQVVNTL